jgi:large conductance mechanosensitive channel
VIINFAIISFCIFLVVKGVNRLEARKKTDPPAPPPSPPPEVALLTEIRDLLRERRGA